MLVETRIQRTVQPAQIVEACRTKSGIVLNTTGDLVEENSWLKDELDECAAKVDANRKWREETLAADKKS